MKKRISMARMPHHIELTDAEQGVAHLIGMLRQIQAKATGCAGRAVQYHA